MAKYQVAIIDRPENWKPETADDVPLEMTGKVGVLVESDDLFEAVGRAMEHNESADAQSRNRWAIVVEPGSVGCIWPSARVCTPVTYKATAIWWPDGWEPDSPWDVPNCVWQARGHGEACAGYPEAEATVLALNRQSMDHPGTTWHVVVAVENEGLSRVVTYDPAGSETTVEVRCMHVIRPQQGGHGNCSHCPAGAMQCAKAEWSSQTQTIAARSSRAFGVGV